MSNGMSFSNAIRRCRRAIAWLSFSSQWSLAAHNATPTLTKEMIAEHIKTGEMEASPLFQTQAQRRIVFANTSYFGAG